MPHPTPQLDYAPAPDRARRRSRRLVLLAFVAIAAITAARYYGPALDHAKLLHYQRRCLAHVDPPDKIAYDETGELGAFSPTAPAPDWDRFYALFSPPGGKGRATVFLHELRHKNGDRRLLAVEFTGPGGGFGSPFHGFETRSFEYAVFEPGSPVARPKLRAENCWPCAFEAFPGPAKPRGLRVFAGQPDPQNATHFTIAVDNSGTPGVIDGWLQSDETILFELRDAPRGLASTHLAHR